MTCKIPQKIKSEIFWIWLDLKLGYTYEAVSYTHLDVYKRQQYKLAYAQIFKILCFWLMATKVIRTGTSIDSAGKKFKGTHKNIILLRPLTFC